MTYGANPSTGSESVNFQSLNDRIPPQNLEAEEAILGSLLLDPEAISRIVDLLKVDAFYLSAHREIYRTALMLHGQGKPTDLTTMAAWLQDQGKLDQVGGQSKLAQLVDRIISTANIDQYAELVTDKYLRRQLIKVGNQIIALGYDTKELLTKILEQSEQQIFALTQDRPRGGLTATAEILTSTFNEIESRSLGTALSGIPCNFYDLDAITQGFQRSDLIIVAGRPAMGKTSFVLNIARNIAVLHRLPVCVFSLEMSKEQLVYRLLSSEVGIESGRLRAGRITTEEWSILGQAMGNLSELPIYIDDTPDMTVTEMRSKARRLQSEQGGKLGLVLIDYLQLMEGASPDNRVQELSKITRSLKSMARELNAPVMTLSQLSRGVESRTNKRPMMSDLRECVTGDTLVWLADGRRLPIADLVGQTPEVISMDQQGHLVKAHTDLVWQVGLKPIYELTTVSGKKIRATGKHRLYTLTGWKPLQELNIGDRLAVANYMPMFNRTNQHWENSRLVLLAHLIEVRTELLQRGKANPNRDTIPLEVFNLVKQEMKSQGISQRQMATLRGTAYGGSSHFQFSPSREVLISYADILDSTELKTIATSDLFWDEIASIQSAGEEIVYDLTVPGTDCWMADGIVSHNSGSIEQDADLIIMLYRDEYYNPDSVDRGLAEIIITKHRNGPTGTVKLLFEPQFTRFRNLANSGN